MNDRFVESCQMEAMQEQEDTMTPVLKQQLQQCETEIRNVMKAIRQGIITDTTKSFILYAGLPGALGKSLSASCLSDISSGSGHCKPQLSARCSVASTVLRAQCKLAAISVLLSPRLCSLRISR